jgi:hypothetical protein
MGKTDKAGRLGGGPQADPLAAWRSCSIEAGALEGETGLNRL